MRTLGKYVIYTINEGDDDGCKNVETKNDFHDRTIFR